MARIDVGGLGIEYQWIGHEKDPPLVITPGGRYPLDTPGVPQLAKLLADAGYRVLLWDRPGCGGSDIAFTAPSESVMNADALVGLIEALELKDVVLLGGSAGSRISMMAAARMPDNVRKMAIWWISGGPVGLAALAWFYCGDQIMAAARGGMEAVAALPSWSDQIARNPGIRDILLAQDRTVFIETMQAWGKAFAYCEDTPVPGMGPQDFARLTMPVMVLRSGESDTNHPRRTSEWTHELLPNSTLVEPPWPDQEWNNCSQIPAAPGRGRFERWPLLAPMLIDYLKA